MKTYIEFEKIIQFETTFIPKDVSNSDYNIALQEVKEGKAIFKPFAPPPPSWEQIRAKRDILLTQSDWTTLTDAQPKPNKEAWLNYRQALRDITSTYSSPEAVIWPQKPIA
jgi:hypothetical protein